MVVLAQEEARKNKCNYIGVEHVLMGVLREEEGLAARVLADLDVETEKVAEIVREINHREGGEEREYEGQIPMTPRTKKCLELALREALGLGHNYIGTEHILLGILREGNNNALDILTDLIPENKEIGIVDRIRNEVIRMLSGPKAPILNREQRDKRIREDRDGQIERERIDSLLKKFHDVLATAVTLGRQLPEVPAERIVEAALVLHG